MTISSFEAEAKKSFTNRFLLSNGDTVDDDDTNHSSGNYGPDGSSPNSHRRYQGDRKLNTNKTTTGADKPNEYRHSHDKGRQPPPMTEPPPSTPATTEPRRIDFIN
ncbi:hypothetical protein ACFE04_014660 [Oxalis oulophora]